MRLRVAASWKNSGASHAQGPLRFATRCPSSSVAGGSGRASTLHCSRCQQVTHLICESRLELDSLTSAAAPALPACPTTKTTECRTANLFATLEPWSLTLTTRNYPNKLNFFHEWFIYILPWRACGHVHKYLPKIYVFCRLDKSLQHTCKQQQCQITYFYQETIEKHTMPHSNMNIINY